VSICCDAVQRMQKSGHEYHNIQYSDSLCKGDLSKTASPLPSPFSGSSASLQSLGIRSPVVSRGSLPAVYTTQTPPIPER